jgi:hypothetical protein
MDIIIKPVGQIQVEHHGEMLKLYENHLAFIEAIKQEVGEEYDNINAPEPLFHQLES